jgi:phenol hydroxylase P3 protein
MDKRVEKTRLTSAQRHAAMTRDLHWDTHYQPMSQVFPMATAEGIRIHDWAAWQDPSRLTLEAYWRHQGEKEKKLYAVIDAYAQNNGHLGVTDARYVNALKLLIQALTPLAHGAHRGHARLARELPGDGLRVACLMQAADQLRHFQNQTHVLSLHNRYFNGLHAAPQWFEQAWYLAPARSYIEDAMASGPFEFLVALSFSHEHLLGQMLNVPFMSAAAHNGDLATASVGFGGQSEATRHMTLGIACVRFMIEQDRANLDLVQRWIDKWFWRGHRLLTYVAVMQDYMLPKRVLSWRAAWQTHVQRSTEALFADLAGLGLRLPAGWDAACADQHHISHQAWNLFYGRGSAVAFHTWVPDAGELQWLTREYPESFARYHRPRLAHLAEREAQGRRFQDMTAPMTCQTCRWPMIFTEPGDPRWIAYREVEHAGEPRHFCSDGCRDIFLHEPERHLHQPLSEQAFLAPTTTDRLDAMTASMQAVGMRHGLDNLGFEGSDDQRHFDAWGGGQSPQEARL